MNHLAQALHTRGDTTTPAPSWWYLEQFRLHRLARLTHRDGSPLDACRSLWGDNR